MIYNYILYHYIKCKNSFIYLFLVQVVFSMTPHHSSYSSHLYLPPFPFALSMYPLYMFLDNPSPFPWVSPPTSPLVTVSLSFISMSLVLFCLLVCFVDYILLIGEIIWYLSFTTWLISLSIMLSSSIHAVAKGISSFFLSAA